MKNILLTSTGLGNKAVFEKFLSIIPKKIGELKLLFIPTASRTEGEMLFVMKSLNELIKIGVQRDNIVWFNPDDISTHCDSTQVDGIYVCGGNTFYLLHKLKDSGFFSKIQKLANEGLLYIGVSAGSVICAPDINYILCMDANDIKLKETSALSFVSSSIIPHYTDELANDVRLLRESNCEVITISDSEALSIQGEIIEKVG